MTTDKDRLVARIFLNSALPLAKVLVTDDPRLASIFRHTTGTVQFVADTEDGPVGAYLAFTDGVLEVLQGIAEQPTLTFRFKTLADLNKLFGGKFAIPRIKGFRHPKLLVKALMLLMGLKILMPDANPKDPAKRALKVKMLLFMVSNGLSQLNKGGDPDMMRYTAKMPDRIFQWSVEPEGIACYLHVKAGNSKAGRGFYARKLPVVHMRFQGIEGAYGVLTSQVDIVEAVIKGHLVIDGSPEYGKDIGVFMKRIEALIT